MTNEIDSKRFLILLLQRGELSFADFLKLVQKVNPTWQQREFVEAVDGGKRRISVRSGHGTGKSFILAQYILWFLLSYEDALVPITGTVFDTLKDTLWGEVQEAFQKLPEELQKPFALKAESLVRIGTKSQATLRTSSKDKPEALQGYHSAHLLLIVDEASGVMEEVFKAARGSLSTRGSIMVMTGNPTRLSGRFYDSHNAKRKLWHCLHWDSEDSPNVDPLFSEEIRTEYGPESNEYKIRVRGDFPDSEESSLIPLDVIMTCVGKDLGDQFGHDLRYGVDVGWQGNDPSVIMKIRGRTTTDVIRRHKTLTTELVGLVIANINNDSPEAVNVDEIGVGAGVRDQLIEAFPEIVNGVNNAAKPMDSKKFANVRAESFWNLREMFFSGEISILNDEDLIAQLTSIKYTYNSRGQIVIAPKDKMKAELGRSPDEADALALGHYHVESGIDAW